MTITGKKIGKTTGIILLLVVLATGVALVLLYAIPVSHPSLTKHVERALLRELALDSCSSGKVTLKVFKGISVTDLFMVKSIGDHQKLLVSIPALKAEYRFVPVVASFFTKKKAAHLKPGSDKKVNQTVPSFKRRKEFSLGRIYSALSQKNIQVSPYLQTLSCDKGAAFIDSQGVENAALGGIKGAVRIKRSKPFHSEIKISIEKAELYGIKAHDYSISFTVNGSRCIVKEFEGNLFSGKASATFDLDLMHDSITAGSLELKGISLGDIYAVAGNTKGVLKGKGALSMKIHPGIARIGLLNGEGAVSFHDISADRIPVIKQFALLTGLGSLSAVTFREAEASFAVREGKISSDDIKGDGDPLSLKMSGWVRTRDGYFNFNVYGIFEKHYKDSVNTIVWESLFPEDKGRRSFRCKVCGTTSSPSVSLDKELAKRAVGTAVKSIEQEIKAILRGK
jgi:hypothetical protein